MKEDNASKIQKSSNYFQVIWGKVKPIFKLFKTDKTIYLYDTGTNKIMKCNELEGKLLEKFMGTDINHAIDNFLSEYDEKRFLDAAYGIRNAIEKENILITNNISQFGLSAHFTNMEELIDTSLKMIVLESTERCNLRCDYCIYNPHYKEKRNFGNADMSLQTAKLAIDYLATHSSNNEKVAISFYGGEPLLRFNFIKDCVDYARRKLEKKDVKLSLTTNATLLSLEAAEYFFKQGNFSITVSLDGPEEIHNSYRKFVNGLGSYKRTLKGLKNLIDVFGDTAHEKIALSMVYSPPFSEVNLNRIAGIWDEIPWLPKKIGIRITYPRSESIQKEKFDATKFFEDKDMLQWAIDKYYAQYGGEIELHPIVSSIIEIKLAKLVNRQIFQSPLEKYHLNGCCIPCTRKLFVSSDGNFNLCERMPLGPSIGNVYEGINNNIIRKIYVDEYSKGSLPFCSSCWAIRICEVCYMHAFHNKSLDFNGKNAYCKNFIQGKERILKLFCSLLEKDKNGLDYLSKFEFT